MLHDESPPSFHRSGEDELIEMLGYREEASEASSAMTEGPGAAADWRDVISQCAYDFIVGWDRRQGVLRTGHQVAAGLAGIFLGHHHRLRL